MAAAAIWMTLVGALVDGGRWPPVAPLSVQYVFHDGPHARVDVAIKGTNGSVLYVLKCRTWLSQEPDASEFDYSGDFECRLVSVAGANWRERWNLLADQQHPIRDWWHRGRFLVPEFKGACLSYPTYGPSRTFRLRGMVVTLTLADWRLDERNWNPVDEPPGFLQFSLAVVVVPDESAERAYAEASPYELPCCVSPNGSCEELDCSKPLPRGRRCPSGGRSAPVSPGRRTRG